MLRSPRSRSAGADEDTAIAALLHDAVEDAGGERARGRVVAAFGERVASIVDEVTEPAKTHPWHERKLDYLAHLECASAEALVVSLCDKLSNSRSLVRSLDAYGVDAWEGFSCGARAQHWWHAELLARFDARADELAPSL